jgi:flavin-dependent dehydrogenase
MSLAPTLSLEEASRRTWDVAIVGAGPAGALAARETARRGAGVLLVDQASFPRWKVCGCCLNGRALGALEAAGLGGLAKARRAVPLEAIALTAGGRSARVALSGSVALSRETFDAALVGEAMRAGAAFLPQTRAALPPEDAGAPGDIRLLELVQGPATTIVRTRCVLAADGLGGKLLARAGVSAAPSAPGSRIGAGTGLTEAPAFYRPGIVYMACGEHGYAGLVRLEDGRLDVAAALDASRVRACGGPGQAVVPLLAEAGWPIIPSLETAAWRGTAALTRRARRCAARRLFVLGDAAGYVEPFTGEGMAWALASALALAPLAVRAARRRQPTLADAWTAWWPGAPWPAGGPPSCCATRCLPAPWSACWAACPPSPSPSCACSTRGAWRCEQAGALSPSPHRPCPPTCETPPGRSLLLLLLLVHAVAALAVADAQDGGQRHLQGGQLLLPG